MQKTPLIPIGSSSSAVKSPPQSQEDEFTIREAKQMSTAKQDTYLRRYTDLPSLIYLLSQKQITLLDPKSWDDSNDSHYLAEYKNKKGLLSILALCFSKAPETYHHWKVFSGGTAGVCIRFKRTTILNSLKNSGVIMGDVQYLSLGDAKRERPKFEDLPFIKRAAYIDESEFRLIYESPTLELGKLDIDIPLSCVNRITLSPWLHKSLVTPIKSVIQNIPGCEKMEVVRSTLIGNEAWKNIARNVT